jgi:phosphoglycerol transferase MdoB-like AlkP superfamily enzyme
MDPAVRRSRPTIPNAPLFSFLSQPPRLIRWVASLAVLFLGVMTLLRVGTHLAFGGGRDAIAQVWPALVLGFRFDARIVAAALLPLLALGAIPFLDPFRHAFGRRFWLTVLGVFSTGLVVFYVCDALHYRYLGQRLNASALSLLGDTSLSLRMIWESYPVLWLTLGIVAAVVGAVAVIVFLHRRAAVSVPASARGKRAVWYVAAVSACTVALYGRIAQYPLRWSDAYTLRNEASANLALNPIESFSSSLRFRTAGFERAKVSEHYARMAAYLGVTRPDPERLSFARDVPARGAAGTRPPNIVLVLCESFSGYKSSMWGNPLNPTPFFAGLTEQGVFFDNCFTPHFGTARGVWALITGIPDVSLVETASRNPAMVDQHTIINDFEGYEKLYFLGGSSSWANIRGLLTNNIGGLKLYEENSYTSPRIDVWGISDKNLFLEADQVLRGQTKPFFAIIQTADNHRPYTIPAEDRDEFRKLDVPAETLKRNGFESLAEFNAFRYTDFAFSKFMEAARQSAYFENTLFVFIGDHGIGGDAGTLFPRAWTENHLTRYHVPLLFYGPKFLPPRRVHAVSSMVDVLPTIAGLANVAYRNTTFGRDLLDRQGADGGEGNLAFIMDHNDQTIGVLKRPYYGVLKPAGGRHDLVWADVTTANPARALNEAERAEYRTNATAYYETARYLLLNNPKPAARKGTAAVLSRAR